MMGGGNDARAHGDIIEEKIERAGAIGVDAAHGCRRHNHGVGTVRFHPLSRATTATQIKISAGDGEDFAILIGEAFEERTSNHAIMTGNENAFTI